ncbi:MAG: clostripain-related cysteine peptidase [Pseudomonadota bacterium]
MKQLIFLLIFSFSSQALALYDFVAINITPKENQISFCFEYDTQLYDNLYIATVTQQAEILFVEPTPEGGVTLTQWGNEVPVFSQWRNNHKPICLNPFAKSALQELQIYAGIGNSLEDVIQRNRILKFFDGFTELPKPEKAWTVMVYMVGADLEAGHHWASKDILEMLQGTASSNNTTNIVITTGGSTRNGWTTVKRSLIENGQQYVLSDLGEKNMAAPETLSDFVTWSKANFPAQHYALILWNHGYGKETSPAGNMMTFKQLDQAYQSIRQQIEEPLDIIVYDTSLMASIEVAEVTARLANAMAGSAELVPGHGIDYAHLLNNIGISPPDNGLAFGSVIKTGYIQETKNKGTFETSQITYSVFDLTQLASFSGTLKTFASEFKDLFEQNKFSDYQTLSRTIHIVPSYPLIESARLRTDSQPIRIDLYNFLQNVKSGFTGFSQSATDLLKILERMIVDYETNNKVHPEAGRVSIDINISDTEHLSVLPEAYRLLNEGLVYYDERRQGDAFTPGGSLTCFGGFTCACGQWLELQADDILGIEAYFGQESGIYLIDKSFYQYKELSEDLNLGVDGHKACQYQLCVNDQHCENISLTVQDNQLFADVRLNDSPAVLSFCQAPEEQWSVCGVVPQIGGIWGRDEVLSPGDSVVPRTLHLKNDEMIEERQGQALIVDDSAPVTLKSHCDPAKGTISAAFYSLNQERQFERLCDDGSCICQEGNTEPGCTHKGFKAGVTLKR